MANNTGGPAFPLIVPFGYDGIAKEGMTLRDYFAAQWLTTWKIDGPVYPILIARCCYEMADAMIEARNA